MTQEPRIGDNELMVLFRASAGERVWQVGGRLLGSLLRSS